MNILCSISVAELLDKITILEIKRAKIHDTDKRRRIEEELSYLGGLSQGIGFRIGDEDSMNELRMVNRALWDINELKRSKGRKRELDTEFIRISVEEDAYNDRRHMIKDHINQLYNSKRELKEYDD